ncbi:MAG: hypothetical protein MUF14_05260 [Hyphomonadaceae bacterium]|jgi:hypothetical protein|nr:hypothetical protein [Hyphomonadaceae bacterium]
MNAAAHAVASAAVPASASGGPVGAPGWRVLVALVSAHFEVSKADLCGPGMARVVSRPRQVLMWLAYRWTPLSTTKIGQLLGGRDHATVIHGYRMIDKNACPEADDGRLLEAGLWAAGWVPHPDCSQLHDGDAP